MRFLNEHEFKSIRMQWIKNNMEQVSEKEIEEMKDYRSVQNEKRVKKPQVLDFREEEKVFWREIFFFCLGM